MESRLRVWVGLAIMSLLTGISANGVSHPTFVQGRMSKEQLNGILSQAHAEQTDTTVPADLSRDSRGLGAALDLFQKNFGGASGFLRNPQVRPPAVSHLISELQKRLGKELTPKEPADVAAMVSALDECLAYLSSPMLVSYMSPDVAQATRHSAQTTLEKMNDASLSTTGVGIRALSASTKEHLSRAAAIDKSRERIPSEVATIQGIESALDQGNARAAVEGWNALKSAPAFPFAQKYIELNQALMADVLLTGACEAKLSGFASASSQVAHAQEFSTIYRCRELSPQKPNAIAFLDAVEPGIRQDVTKDFGMMPSREDLTGWLDTSQKLGGMSTTTLPQQIAAISDTLALKSRYGTLPAASALISQSLTQQVQAVEKSAASAPACEIGDSHVPSAVAKGRDALTAQLTRLQAQAVSLNKALSECSALAKDTATMQPVLALLQPATQTKLTTSAEQFQIGTQALEEINTRSAEVEQELHHLDELKATHEAEMEQEASELEGLSDQIVSTSILSLQLYIEYKKTDIPLYMDKQKEAIAELIHDLRPHRARLGPAFWENSSKKLSSILRGIPEYQHGYAWSIYSEIKAGATGK